MEGPPVTVLQVINESHPGPPTSPRSVAAAKRCCIPLADLRPVDEDCRRAAVAAIKGKLNQGEVLAVGEHLADIRQEKLRAIAKARAEAIEAAEQKRRIQAVARAVRRKHGSPAPSIEGSAATGDGEMRRLEQIRLKQKAEMQASLEAELDAADRIREAAAEAKAREAEDKKKQKELEEKREEEAKARHQAEEAKAKRFAEAEAAAVSKRKAWQAKEQKRLAKLEKEREKERQERLAADKLKQQQIAAARLERDRRIEETASTAAWKAAEAKAFQQQLAARLEEEAESKRQETADKAAAARARIEAAIEAQKVKLANDKARFEKELADAEVRLERQKAEIRSERETKAREAQAKRREAHARVEKTRSDTEQWRDRLVTQESKHEANVRRLRQDQAEGAKPAVLARRLRAEARKATVERLRQSRAQLAKDRRARLEAEQAADRARAARHAALSKRVDSNARDLLVEKHALMHETDLLLITKKYDAAKKRVHGAKGEAADEMDDA